MNTLAQMIAEARALDEQRLELSRELRTLQKRLETLSTEVIAAMIQADMITCEGARIEEVQKPFISSFSDLESYIIEHGALDLLQKRLTESAVRLRWEDGIEIPGVGVSTEQKLRL